MVRVATALMLLLGCMVPFPAEAQPSRIPALAVAITDGDTITVQLGDGTRERTRLIGIDTPETKHPTKPVMCYGPESTAQTTELAAGKEVELELDVQQRDRYGRLLAYVWIKETGQMLNLQLAAEGYALPLTIPPNVAYAELFAAAAASAREQGAGLWGGCGGGEWVAEIEPTVEDVVIDAAPQQSQQAAPPPPPPPAPAPPPPPAASSCHPSYPDFCVPPPPPDLDCPDLLPRQNFTVRQPDPHRFDADRDGVGCESR